MLSFKIKRFCFYVIKVACLSYGEYIYKIPSTTNLTSIFGNHVHLSIESGPGFHVFMSISTSTLLRLPSTPAV